MIDRIKVILVNLGALGITLANIQTVLAITSMIVAISYTIWKWRRDIKINNNI